MITTRNPIAQIKPEKVRKTLKPYMWIDNNGWVAEKKLDGARFLLHMVDGENRFTSRHTSVNDGLFVEKTDNFKHLRDILFPGLEGTVLDGEIVLGSNVMDVMSVVGAKPEKALQYQTEHGYVSYVVFDILQLAGTDVRAKPYHVRNRILYELLRDNTHPGIYQNTAICMDKKIFYYSVLNEGGEGVVLKDINAPYGENWAKAKRTATFDVVIMGFEEPTKVTTKSDGTLSNSRLFDQGLIGSVIFGQYVNGELTKLGSTSGMDDKIRRMFSDNPDKFIGNVIEIKAQERTESGAFRHPAFIRMRPDKNASECIYRINEN